MDKKKLISLFFVFGLTSKLAFASLDESGLEISAAADIVGEMGFQDSGVQDRFYVRSAELLLYGPTDYLFQARLSLGAHPYQGEMNFGLHEAFVSSSRLIPRTRFQLGQFFLGVGRLNTLHQHDWPFISTPIVQKNFFDGEGILDTGLQASVLMPTPFYLDLTFGITNGWRITHSHGDMGAKPKVPTHYLRAEFFKDWESGGLKYALNYLGRRDAESTWLFMSGLDVVAKWRQSRILKWMIQSEVWSRTQKPKNEMASTEIGSYIFAQYALNQNYFVGLRFDAFTNLDLQNASAEKLTNWQFEASPQVLYELSEFSRFRVAYAFENRFEEGKNTEYGHRLECQIVFILGAHPAHEF